VSQKSDRRRAIERVTEEVLDGRYTRGELMRRAAALGLAAPAVASLLAACGGDDEEEGGEAAAEGGGDRAKDLKLLCWEGYSSDAVLDPFRQEFGAAVTAELHVDDPTSINRLRAGDNKVFDIINVNNNWAQQVMFPDGLIVPLDQEDFQQYFEPGRVLPQFEWPYRWAMSLDGTALLGTVQRFGPFNFVINTDVISAATAEDEGWNLFLDAANKGRFGVLTYPNWNVMHLLLTAGIDPFVEHSDADIEAFSETAATVLGNAKIKTDDFGALTTAMLNGEIDMYFTGGTYTTSPARLEGHTNVLGITPATGAGEGGKGGITWIEVTSIVNNPNVSPLATEFLHYVQRPEVGHTVAMAEGTHNPIAQMGNPDVFAEFTKEELVALQWDTLEAESARTVDYNVIPREPEFNAIYSEALRA
jgi:spermidine/putrescine transport system substrate-binding protein